MLQTLPGLKSNNIDIFRMLLANNIPHFSSVHIKQHWYFQRVTGKQCTRFQKLDQTTLTFSESYWQTKLQTFSDFISLSNNTDIFREVLTNNTTNFSRFYIIIKQYWHFQSYWQAILQTFQSWGNTTLTLSKSYYQTILTYSELISNGIHNITELLPNNGKYFFESFHGHLNRQKILKEKIRK